MATMTVSARGTVFQIRGGKVHKTPSQKVAEIERLKAIGNTDSKLCNCGLFLCTGQCEAATAWRAQYITEHTR